MRWLLKKARFLYNRSFRDETYVRIQYRKLLGRPLDLNNPTGFHEKVCWLRLNRFTPLQTYCADKITVAAYVCSRLGPGFTVPRQFVTTNVDALSAELIPSGACIIKPNHASQAVAVIEDTASADWHDVRARMAASLKRNHYWWARERQYRDIQPTLIIEDLIDMSGVNPGEVNMYCLDGRATFSLVFEPQAILAGNRGVLVDRSFKPLPVTRQRYPTNEKVPPRPPELERMIEAAEALASPFPFGARRFSTVQVGVLRE